MVEYDDRRPWPVRDFSEGFFSASATMEAISDLASCDELTLFIGAGGSADQGYPTWAGLVSRLLAERLSRDSGLPSAELKQIAKATTDEYYQIPTATIIDETFRQQFPSKETAKRERNDALRRLLYQGAPAGVRAPALAEEALELAIFKVASGKRVHIVTTNYDDLLNQCATTSLRLTRLILEWGLKVEVFDVDPPDDLDSLTIPIVHVHGRLPRTGSLDSKVIFSEADYMDWDDSSPFRIYLNQRFSRSRVLLLGTSLRDYNIAAKLRAGGPVSGTRRYALLPAQSEFKGLRAPGMLRSQVANYAVVRGRQLGVRVLRPDFYGQVTQFLQEIAVKEIIGASAAPLPYTERLDAWASNWLEIWYQDSDRLARGTAALHDMAQLLKEKLGPQVEHVKTELWVRTRPRERSLELWADSESIRQTASRAIGLTLFRSIRRVITLPSSASRHAVSCMVCSLLRLTVAGRTTGRRPSCCFKLPITDCRSALLQPCSPWLPAQPTPACPRGNA